MNDLRILACAVSVGLCVCTGCGTETMGGTKHAGAANGDGDGKAGDGDHAAAGDGDQANGDGDQTSGDGDKGATGDGDGPEATTLPAAFRTLLTRDYLAATSDGVSATGKSDDGVQTFTLSDLNGGELAAGDDVLVQTASGKYLSAVGGGGAALVLSADAGAAETFTLQRLSGSGALGSGDQIALKTKGKENYVSAINGGGGEVKADAPWAKGWETFVLDLIGKPADPGSSAAQAKQKVLDYFAGISGSHTLAGIENKFNTDPHGHTDQVAGHAGKTPSFWGIDFGFGAEAVDNRAAIVTEAQNQWAKGAVVAFMYHTCVPTRDEYCDWDDIGGKHPVHLSADEWDQLFTEGTDVHNEWMSRLDKLAGHFQTLKDAGVAPLFRPFHEMNQCAFWWSCQTEENGTVKLWKLTHDYLVKDKGLDNIIWVWNIQDFPSVADDSVQLSPGADYFDLATLDIYNQGFTMQNYQVMQAAAKGKPMGIGECQYMPGLDVLDGQPDWTFFMLWPDFIEDQRNLDLYVPLFASDRIITLDEMPGWN